MAIAGRLFVAAAILCLVPRPATADVDVSAGYSLVDYRGRETLPVGWYVSVVAKRGDWFAVATELAAEYDTPDGSPSSGRQMAFAFLDGPRVITTVRRVSVFGELLFGIARDRALAGGDGANRFMVKPGVGIDIELGTHVSVRFAGGRRFHSATFSSGTATEFHSGLVITSKK